jgi:hypothetical protein
VGAGNDLACLPIEDQEQRSYNSDGEVEGEVVKCVFEKVNKVKRELAQLGTAQIQTPKFTTEGMLREENELR